VVNGQQQAAIGIRASNLWVKFLSIMFDFSANIYPTLKPKLTQFAVCGLPLAGFLMLE
jgi:hypothetical protein